MALTSIQLIDYAGMGFLAASGAIAAAERREDAVTFIFFGTFTGVGGGTLRDLLIGAPAFWVAKPDYLVLCIVASLAVWIWPMRWTTRRSASVVRGRAAVACWNRTSGASGKLIASL